jgi:hypothetical protein
MGARLAAAVTLAALLLPVAPAAAGDPIMQLGEVRAGMVCTGYSVVRGTDVASFRVEVIDVVGSQATGDQPLIIVGVSGPAIDATGVGPGFSGSPIYCPDAAGVQRNIGAISASIGSYGGKVVLATPIEALLANPVEAPRARPPSARAAAARRRLRREGVRPLAAPLTVSGVTEPLGRALAAAGERVGRRVLTVPAGPFGGFAAQTLRPGSAVSVAYASGDLVLSGIGTVSYVDGDRVWAFGHPFEAAGARSLLLQDAYVFGVVNEPNAAFTGGSYKLAVGGHDLGTLTNDALSAVVGAVGTLPPTVPMHVVARDRDTGAERVLDVTVADETDVDNPTGAGPLSTVAPLTVAQAATVLRSAPGRLTGTMCMSVVFRERPRRPARFCNRYLSSTLQDGGPFGSTVAGEAAADVAHAVGLIESYEGRAPHVRRVSARLELERGERLAIMRSVKAPRRVRPGQIARLRVTLQRVRGGRVTRTYRVRIPRGIRAGRRPLMLVGAREELSDEELLELLLGGDIEEVEPSRGPASLDGLISAIGSLRRWDGVRLRLGSARGRAFRDERLLISGRVATIVRVARQPSNR